MKWITVVLTFGLLSLGCQKGTVSGAHSLQLHFVSRGELPRGETEINCLLKNTGRIPVTLQGWYFDETNEPPNVIIYWRKSGGTNEFFPGYDISMLYNESPGKPFTLRSGEETKVSTTAILNMPPGEYDFFTALRADKSIRTAPTVFRVLPGEAAPIREK